MAILFVLHLCLSFPLCGFLPTHVRAVGGSQSENTNVLHSLVQIFLKFLTYCLRILFASQRCLFRELLQGMDELIPQDFDMNILSSRAEVFRDLKSRIKNRPLCKRSVKH